MASQEELNNQKQYNASLGESVKKSQDLKETLSEILFEQRSFTDEARKLAQNLFKSSTQATATARAFRGVSSITREINSQIEDIISGEREYENLAKSINKLKKEESLLNVELGQALAAATDNLGVRVFNEEQINEVLEGRLGVLDLVAQSEREVNNVAFDLLAIYDSQNAALKDQNKELKKVEERAKIIQDGTGLAGSIFGGIEDIANKLGGSKFVKTLGLDEAVSEGRKLSAVLTKGGNETASTVDKTKVLGKMFEVVGKNVLKALGPLALIAELVKGIMQADKETTELQKSMALSKTEAAGFRLNLGMAASASGNINITSSKLLETFSALNKQFGFITNFAAETLVTMTKLTKVVGVSSESAGNLAAASELTGTSFESNYKDVLATSYELQRQSGVQMDLRDILEQTGKVTGTVRANLGANPTLISKAITQAKLFGASLEQVASAGKSLLDFESSITAELEAELLLGRNINLERARAAALAGDQVTLAQELQKEAGNFSDFTKMNVIQQEALAKAMGMTSDQLADILFQQEVQGKSAKELRALGKEDLAQRVEAQDLQTKFNATVEKLQGIFADVGTAITPILQILGSALSIVGALVGLIGDIVKMFQGDFSFSGFLGGIKSAGSGIADAFGTTSTADDAIIPSGYGETIIKKGKDTIALNNNDTVVAGTNLGGGNGDQEAKKTNQLLERLLNQPAVFKIGTDEFYTATSKYSYQIQ
jgi:hypothetical protein